MPSFCTLAAAGAVLVIVAGGIALAETRPGDHPTGADHIGHMTPGQHPMAAEHMQGTTQPREGMSGGHGGMHASAMTPTSPGQDAFGAIQEIVRMLEADPKTDWSKIDLEALRQHLIDMHEVTLRADAASQQIDGGLKIAVTGDGRTLVAIRPMLPAWAQMADGHKGWSATTVELPNGELLTVTATDPKETRHIRGLGFIGLLASGSWHQPHHLAMAKGEFDPIHGHQGH